MHRPILFLLAAFILMAGMCFLGGCGGAGAPVADGPRMSAAEVGTSPMLVLFKDTPGQDDEDDVKARGGRIKEKFDLVPAMSADLPAAAIEGLRHNPHVAAVEPDAEVTGSADTLPWGVNKIDAEVVQAAGNTGAGIKVAVLDSGIEYTHPDLDGNYKGGYDYVNNDTNPMDDHGHGTHVAGTIAAEANGVGVVGVAPGASLYALKVLDAKGTGNYSTIISALQWCVTNKVQVANMSLGSTAYSATLEAACNNAVAAGVVLVAAAGNTGSGDTVEYPARFAAVIAVASVDSSNQRASSSSTGPAVELAAPGVTIYSTLRGGKYGTMSGTSMACPHVSGTAALLIASGLSAPQSVRDRMNATADDLGAVGRDTLYGYGLVDANEAVGVSAPAPTPPPPTTTALRVSSISVVVTSTRTSKSAKATVNVVDSSGKVASGVTVSGHWSGLATDTDTGITGTKGTVTLQSNSTKSTTGTFVFTVDSLAKLGFAYDSTSNTTSAASVSL